MEFLHSVHVSIEICLKLNWTIVSYSFEAQITYVDVFNHDI